MFESSSDKPILITGATGFLGSYILRLLHREGLYCRAMKRSTSSMELVKSIEKEVEWVEGDMTDYESLEQAIEGAQAVIHSAAMVAFTKREHNKMLRVNAYGTRDLVNMALERSVGKFVYISSISTLGRNPEKPYINEESNFTFGKLDTGYAVSKHLGEMEVWRGGAEGLPIAILNPSLILGSGKWDSGTCKIFKHAYNGLPFYTDGCSAYVDVRDVARMTHQLLVNDIVGERYICAGEAGKQKRILDLICKHLGKQPPKRKLNPIIGRMATWVEGWRSRISDSNPIITKETLRIAKHCFEFDNSKSIQELGFQYTPIETTIRETAKDFLEALENGLEPRVLELN